MQCLVVDTARVASNEPALRPLSPSCADPRAQHPRTHSRMHSCFVRACAEQAHAHRPTPFVQHARFNWMHSARILSLELVYCAPVSPHHHHSSPLKCIHPRRHMTLRMKLYCMHARTHAHTNARARYHTRPPKSSETKHVKVVEKRAQVYIDPVASVTAPIKETGPGMLYMIKVGAHRGWLTGWLANWWEVV